MAWIAFIAVLLVSLVPSILGEFARLSMLRAHMIESRRVTAAVVAGVVMAFAATYGALFTYAAGKVSWSEDADALVLGIETREEAIKLYARMWLLNNGLRTYQELLDSPNALIAYHAHSADMKVDE